MSVIEVDARGLRCPWPALRLARAARAAGPGGEITIIADDPSALGEIMALAAAQGWRVQELTGSDTLSFRIYS